MLRAKVFFPCSLYCRHAHNRTLRSSFSTARPYAADPRPGRAARGAARSGALRRPLAGGNRAPHTLPPFIEMDRPGRYRAGTIHGTKIITPLYIKNIQKFTRRFLSSRVVQVRRTAGAALLLRVPLRRLPPVRPSSFTAADNRKSSDGHLNMYTLKRTLPTDMVNSIQPGKAQIRLDIFVWV